MSVNAATVTDLLNGTGAFHVRFPNQGLHAEGDLSDQVLAYIRGDKVFELLPISSGKPSTPTILGSYRVYRKQPEYTSDGMYFSNYFTGGYAIHGYNPSPDYPTSHGCMRIPDADAIFAYNLLSIGDWGRHLLHVVGADDRRPPPLTHASSTPPARRCWPTCTTTRC